MKRILFAALVGLTLISGASIPAQEQPKFTRTEDVIYGRKLGTALTLDVFEPAKKNGAAVFFVVSGGFVSSHSAISVPRIQPLLDRGYTVFAVVHGSQPRFIIPEIEEDIHRAVRFVRSNAARWGVDPNKFGITGASAGAHLSLKVGVQGGPGKANAQDPIDRQSSAVQAVACFYPVSDFTNFSKPGELMWEHSAPHTPATSFGPKGTTREGQLEQGRQISSINYVTAKMPPTLVLHGEADTTVPVYQSQMLEKKCQEVGATFKLIVKPGAGHGNLFGDHIKETGICADWFDEHLLHSKAK
ncbi:MAG: alpha/beta hydrolase [Opitutaceae bacterium]